MKGFMQKWYISVFMNFWRRSKKLSWFVFLSSRYTCFDFFSCLYLFLTSSLILMSSCNISRLMSWHYFPKHFLPLPVYRTRFLICFRCKVPLTNCSFRVRAFLFYMMSETVRPSFIHRFPWCRCLFFSTRRRNQCISLLVLIRNKRPSSNTWEQEYEIKIPCTKKLRED